MSFDNAQKCKTAYEKLQNQDGIISVELNQALKTGFEDDWESNYDEVQTSETELGKYLSKKEVKQIWQNINSC